MRKLALSAMVLSIVIPAAAWALVGNPPIASGPSLQDGTWLNGLASGQNYTYQSGITAAGSAQASCQALTPGYRLYELDTVASSTGICLPFALPGTSFSVYNNGAQTVTFYPAIANNPISAAQDTINNSTSKTAATHVSTYFYAVKAGVWAAQ